MIGPLFLFASRYTKGGVYSDTIIDSILDDAINGLCYMYKSKERLLEDLPTNTNNDWINSQNEKLNRIPMCKPRND